MTMAAVVSCLALGSFGCTTNPATGEQQLSLYSERQEVAMGRQYDEQIVQQLGLYGDEDLRQYVQRIGERLAADSERPDLPWTFRVIDDPVINAFALPGGFIYVTRGIMSHVGSEGELAAVLAHEIAHVTARHSVNRMSKAQLATLGLGLGSVFVEEIAQFGDLAQAGLSLMFLKFSRDDERQADDLGLKYLQNSTYPLAAMPEVFSLLERVSGEAEGTRLPGWLATHPAPADRRDRIEERIAAAATPPREGEMERASYLSRIEGMVYGDDPRQGFFWEGWFYHPELAFKLRSPRGWTEYNQRQAVLWQQPQERALMILTIAEHASPEVAARDFFRQQGIRSAGRWRLRGLARGEVAAAFEARSRQQALEGGVAFVELGDRVYRLLGVSRDGEFGRYDEEVAEAVESFSRLRERRWLDVEPMRVEVVTLGRSMSLREVARRYDVDVELGELALLNNVDGDAGLERGRRVKIVRGFNPTRS